MKATVEYYKPEIINANNFSLVSLKKYKEEEVDYSENLESKTINGEVIIVKYKEGEIINANVDCKYKFPFPVKIFRIGIPKEFNNENVKIDYINVAVDSFIIGLNFDLKDYPFIILDTSDGTKIISSSDINEVKPTIVKNKKKKKSKKAKKKKNAKKSSKKRKVKSKSARKS
ncbi:hypothetical protein [Acidianus hospitalis]|jgi:hypothetical protein|uniref:Uncharacterized protein n=2 Tax=Acidianus hospitalis TaxID=563177 RepID=A0A2T9X753_9CREN|nr:hypothetical protein [Acidianus hospitalis]AEE94224.1 hypothetical protein Ahos_1341 [Acidianus hospitalis W1]PVU75928.1 hypothetical protein DDW13_04210 [Acidianus hospitalis]